MTIFQQKLRLKPFVLIFRLIQIVEAVSIELRSTVRLVTEQLQREVLAALT